MGACVRGRGLGQEALPGARTSACVGRATKRSRTRRCKPRPVGETRLELIERILDAYGLVLLLILVTFVVTMTLPTEGWAGRVVAIAVAGLTAVIALTRSDVRPGRVRLAVAAAAVAIVAAALAKAVSSDGLLDGAFIIDALLLTVTAVTILHR